MTAVPSNVLCAVTLARELLRPKLDESPGGAPRAGERKLPVDTAPPTRPLPKGLTWAGASRWLLEEM